jgi:hypothetical protein
MFIQYPIIVESITTDNAFDSNNEQKHVGQYVMIKLNQDGYDEDVHLGLYLGELPTSIITLFDSHDKAIRNKFMKTPAIYVFKYKKMFYGTYQRWQFIESKSDFDLIDLKCSYNVDNNVSQLSKPFSNTNMIVGGKI